MTTLRQFIADRETEVRSQLRVLKAEMAELKRVRAALEEVDRGGTSSEEGSADQPSAPTIKDMIRAVVREASPPEGLSSGEIGSIIKLLFEADIERTSLSPQLSRLRRDGELELDDGKWLATDQIKIVSLGSIRAEGSSAQTPEPSISLGPDGRGKAFPASTPEGSIPSGSTPVKKPAYEGSFTDDLDDDTPF